MPCNVFKPILEGIEKRLSNAAYEYAGQIVKQLQDATYANSCGHYSNNFSDTKDRENFWLNVKVAHRDALLVEVSAEIEAFAVQVIKRKADEWEKAAKVGAAAGCYAMFGRFTHPLPGNPPPFWPWAKGWWKPGAYRRNLVKAGALILAEIERLDRKGGAE